jgi:biotin-dependent carboxylase-like uncharacterized protein
MPDRCLTVLETGPLATFQDEGRIGLAGQGIGRSGACDRRSYELANRLVGNRPGAPAVEVTYGGLRVRAECHLLLTTTGAYCPGAPYNAPELVRAGTELRLGPPVSGLRTYLSVRGGFSVDPVLGSCSTDILSGLGPAALAVGDLLRVGDAAGPAACADVAPLPQPEAGLVRARVLPGPRRDWFTDAGWDVLVGQVYRVSSDSNRVGIRLDGEPLERAVTRELPSEGMVRGALQVPPSGTPVLFLADHPVTGGYPVIGYVHDADVDRCGQLRPGQELRFTAAAD